MTVADLETRMSAAEMDEWRRLECVDPWGQSRDDVQHAYDRLITALASGVSRKRLRIGDFVLYFGSKVKRKKAGTDAEFVAAMRLFAAAQNERAKRQGDATKPPVPGNTLTDDETANPQTMTDEQRRKREAGTVNVSPIKRI